MSEQNLFMNNIRGWLCICRLRLMCIDGGGANDSVTISSSNGDGSISSSSSSGSSKNELLSLMSIALPEQSQFHTQFSLWVFKRETKQANGGTGCILKKSRADTMWTQWRMVWGGREGGSGTRFRSVPKQQQQRQNAKIIIATKRR